MTPRSGVAKADRKAGDHRHGEPEPANTIDPRRQGSQELKELKDEKRISATKATKTITKRSQREEYGSHGDSEWRPIHSHRINKKPLGLTQLLQDDIPAEQVTMRNTIRSSIKSGGKEEHLDFQAYDSRTFHQLDAQKSAHDVMKMENHIK